MSFSKQEKDENLKRLSNLPEKLEAHTTPAEEQPKKKKPLDEAQRQILIDRQIQEAMENGEFDNLPGKGKPLVFDDNPYLEPGQELAFGLLKQNGFAPEWIERDKAIRKELEAAQKLLRLAWQQRRHDPGREAKWQAAVAQFEESLNKLNRKIDDFNLIAPVLSAQRPRLRLADEIRRIQAEP